MHGTIAPMAIVLSDMSLSRVTAAGQSDDHRDDFQIATAASPLICVKPRQAET